MGKIGRPATKEKKLKDGWYIRVSNKGMSSGIKIWSKDEADMLRAIKRYERSKDIIVLGECLNGKFTKDKKPKKKKAPAKKAAPKKED